jgi:hypothetical protein
MIKLNSVKDIENSNIPGEIAFHLGILTANTITDNPLDINVLNDFESTYGGHIFVVETLEDLDAVLTNEESELPKGEQSESSGGWATIREKPGHFDIAQYLPSYRYALFWMATNDSGGPSFYIPMRLADECPNLIKSISMSADGASEVYLWSNLLKRKDQAVASSPPFDAVG